MNLSNVVVAIISVIMTAVVISDVADYRWQKVCESLDIKIEWHRHVVDGIAKDWVEMIDLRNGDVRKSEVK